MRISILHNRDMIYEEEAYQAVLPGEDGEFAMMDFHQPCLYKLQQGRIKIYVEEKSDDYENFPITNGIARFRNNELLILCEK